MPRSFVFAKELSTFCASFFLFSFCPFFPPPHRPLPSWNPRLGRGEGFVGGHPTGKRRESHAVKSGFVCHKSPWKSLYVAEGQGTSTPYDPMILWHTFVGAYFFYFSWLQMSGRRMSGTSRCFETGWSWSWLVIPGCCRHQNYSRSRQKLQELIFEIASFFLWGRPCLVYTIAAKSFTKILLYKNTIGPRTLHTKYKSLGIDFHNPLQSGYQNMFFWN